MIFEAAAFEWDEGNLTHCKKHGVSVAEIEEILQGTPLIAPDLKYSETESRFVAVGRTLKGRTAFVVFTMRDKNVRPLSARYMHPQEVIRYET